MTTAHPALPELDQALLEIATVNAIVREISGKAHVDEVVQGVIDHALQYLDVERMSVSLLDPATDAIRPRWVSGVPFERVRMHPGIPADHPVDIGAACVRDREPALCRDAATDPRTDKEIVAFTRTKSFAVIPLVEDGRGIGFIGFEVIDPEREISEDDLPRFRRFADTLALFFRNARLYEELESLKNHLERRVAEKTAELREANEYILRFTNYLSALVRHAPGGILATDEAGRLRFANDAAARMLALPPGAASGSPARDLFRPRDWEARVLPALALPAAEGEALARNWECEMLSTAGEPVRVSLTIVRFLEPTLRTPAFLFVLHDLREVRLLESKLIHTERLRLIGQMAAGVFHELSAPHAVIEGSLALVRERLGDADPVVRKHLGFIESAARRGREFTRQLLDLSRDTPIRPRRVAPAAWIRRAVELFRLRRIPRGVALVTDIPDGLPDLSADPDKLDQALLNLLGNAVDAVGEAGRIAVTASARTVTPEEIYIDGYRPRRSDDPPGSEYILFRARDMATLARFGPFTKPGDRVVAVEVADDGPGIPAERMASLFEPFRTTKEHGSGLGLAILLGVVKRHHGAIRVSSAPGEGTRFTLLLPIHDDLARFERTDTLEEPEP